MSDWLAICDEKDRGALLAALRAEDAEGTVEWARTPDALRGAALEAAPGALGVAIGPFSEGVSGVNLAAAVARDANARTVMLMGRGVSGSVRSRAVRAGIDAVIDLDEVGDLPTGGAANDGGRLARPPALAAPPVEVPLDADIPGAPIVTFCSGRGGVGKTALVATAAAMAARWGMSVCALDLDLSCGDLFSCFGLPGGSDLARLASEPSISHELVERLKIPVRPGLFVLGPCERPEAAELAMASIGLLIRVISTTCDLVLVDTSTTFTDAVAQAAQLADRLVIVSDGRAGSLSSLARTSGLAVRLGVARTRIARLENRANPRERANLAAGRAEVGLEAARAFRAFEGGAEVEDQLASGRVVDLAESGSPFAESVATVLAQILAELGSLPECEEAVRAREGSTTRGLLGLFGLRREAR